MCKSLSSQVLDKNCAFEVYKKLGVSFVSGNSNFKKAICEFHIDTDPSFTVYKNSGRYVCFSCGAKGDIVEYAAFIWGLNPKQDFKEIKYKLANLAEGSFYV